MEEWQNFIPSEISNGSTGYRFAASVDKSLLMTVISCVHLEVCGLLKYTAVTGGATKRMFVYPNI